MATYEGTRNQGNKLAKRYSKTNIRKHTFTNRVGEEWNNLPKEVKEAPTLNTFKNRLDRIPEMIEKFYVYDDRQIGNQNQERKQGKKKKKKKKKLIENGVKSKIKGHN